ncbi:hypothetical protein OG21DRAFT_904199 [Imleria badia]|nr:hypothetical protein OG21DRAFT_904199 [Imleria badia]
MRYESVPSVRTVETPLHAPPPPAPLRVVPAHVRVPFYEHRTPSPPHDLDEPETIHSIPIASNQATSVSRADSRTSYIRPDELWQPIPSPSSITIEAQESRATQKSEPTPVSLPVQSHNYDHQTSVSPAISRGHTPSIPSCASTHISQYHLATKRPGNLLRNMIDVGRARNGSQPPLESTSRDDHRDRDRRHSNRTEAESITKQWRVDDGPSSPWNHLGDPWLCSRVPTESAALPLHPLLDDPVSQPTRTRSESITPTPLGDVNDPQPRRFVPTKSTAAHSRPLPDPPMSLPTRTGFPPDNLRHRFRQPRQGSNSSSSSILNTIVASPLSSTPNIMVEPPSTPEMTMSLSATVADTLSPEAGHRPLPWDDAHQHQHRPSHSHSHSHSQSQPPSRHNHPSSSYETPQPSGTTFTPQAVGFIPSHPTPTSAPNRNETPLNDHVWTHTQSAWELDSDGDRDRDRDRDREKIRDALGDWYRDRDREWGRDSGRDYERERNRDRDRDGEGPDTNLDKTLSRPPLPLQ